MSSNFAELVLSQLKTDFEKITATNGFGFTVSKVYDEWRVDLSEIEYPSICFELMHSNTADKTKNEIDVMVVVRDKNNDLTHSARKELLIKEIETFFVSKTYCLLRTLKANTTYYENYLRHEITEIYRYSVNRNQGIIEIGFLLKIYYSKNISNFIQKN